MFIVIIFVALMAATLLSAINIIADINSLKVGNCTLDKTIKNTLLNIIIYLTGSLLFLMFTVIVINTYGKATFTFLVIMGLFVGFLSMLVARQLSFLTSTIKNVRREL